jgi:hypothetical protein
VVAAEDLIEFIILVVGEVAIQGIGTESAVILHFVLLDGLELASSCFLSQYLLEVAVGLEYAGLQRTPEVEVNALEGLQVDLLDADWSNSLATLLFGVVFR